MLKHPWVQPLVPETKRKQKLDLLPEMGAFFVHLMNTKADSKQVSGAGGSKRGPGSSYHINHSSNVVHLKWGVKRSFILPRSSCFKTRTCGLLSPLQLCGAVAGGPTPPPCTPTAGRSCRWARHHDEAPGFSPPQQPRAPPTGTLQGPEDPFPTWSPAGLAPEAPQGGPWTRGAGNHSKGVHKHLTHLCACARTHRLPSPEPALSRSR